MIDFLAIFGLLHHLDGFDHGIHDQHADTEPEKKSTSPRKQVDARCRFTRGQMAELTHVVLLTSELVHDLGKLANFLSDDSQFISPG